MLTTDPTESIKVLKSLVATLGLLLILSNALWFIVYTASTGPLAKPTPTVTVTSLPSPTPTPTRTVGSPSPTASPSVSPTPSL